MLNDLLLLFHYDYFVGNINKWKSILPPFFPPINWDGKLGYILDVVTFIKKYRIVTYKVNYLETKQ